MTSAMAADGDAAGPPPVENPAPTQAAPEAPAPKPHHKPPVRPSHPLVRRLDSKRPALGELVAFTHAPYPYDGMIPEQNKAFFDVDAAGHRYHLSPRGGKYEEAQTYSDSRSLLYIPPAFDPHGPDAAIVLFFHGNLATLEDVRGRQAVPRQLRDAHLDAVLVAPQLAVDALDSSPGRFWERGFLKDYLDEAATHLAEQSRGRFTKADFDALPVIIVAYSGGYLATAFSLHYDAGPSRIKGVILLDALFGEAAKIEDWIERTKGRTFFFSAYSAASQAQNAALTTALAAHGITVRTTLPGALAPGDVVMVSALKAVHNDFVTKAWTTDPLAKVLASLSAAGRASDDTRDAAPPPKPKKTRVVTPAAKLKPPSACAPGEACEPPPREEAR